MTQRAVARAQRANVVPWIVCNSAASCCRNYATVVGEELRNTCRAGAANYGKDLPAATCSAGRNARRTFSRPSFRAFVAAGPEADERRKRVQDKEHERAARDAIAALSLPTALAMRTVLRGVVGRANAGGGCGVVWVTHLLFSFSGSRWPDPRMHRTSRSLDELLESAED